MEDDNSNLEVNPTAEKEEEEEILEDQRYWFGDVLGEMEIEEEEVLEEREKSKEKDFPSRQGVVPTLPDEDAGTWQDMLKKTEKKEEKDLSEMVKRGLAKETRQGHRRIINWLAEVERPPENIGC